MTTNQPKSSPANRVATTPDSPYQLPEQLHPDDVPLIGEALATIEVISGYKLHLLPADTGQSIESDWDQPMEPVVAANQIFGYLTCPSATDECEHITQSQTNLPDRSDQLKLLARLLGQIMEQEYNIRHRVAELGAVYKVATDLTGSKDLEELLANALSVIIDVLNVDAGSIRLVDEETGELDIKTTQSLSDAYLQRGPVLAPHSTLDIDALQGDVVYVEDLRIDTRVRYPDLVIKEGVQSFLATGMIFHDKPLGVIRLYTRSKRRFTEFDKGLLQVTARQVATRIENRRLAEYRKIARQSQRQVELAKNVQQRMLPEKPPGTQGLDVAARCLPSLDLGGDFYDFIELDKNNLGIVLGDVVGKGIPAALQAASIRASIRAHALDVYDLDVVLSKANYALYLDSEPSEFATVWYGVIDQQQLRLTYCNAGHEPALLCRQKRTDGKHVSVQIITLGTGGLILGIDPDTIYEKGTVDLQPDDLLIVFSDGLPDAQNFDLELYGKLRIHKAIKDILHTNPNASAQMVKSHLLWEARRFVGLHTRSDDMTIVVAKIAPPPAP